MTEKKKKVIDADPRAPPLFLGILTFLDGSSLEMNGKIVIFSELTNIL